jgi:hypothetical protein
MTIEKFEYNGKTYGIHSGAAWRVAKVQKILGMDFFQDIQTLAGEPWKLLVSIDDPQKLRELLSVIIDGEIDDELLEMGTTDLVRVLTPFFSDVVTSRSRWNGELRLSGTSTQETEAQFPREDTPSTSPSSELPGETRN